MNNLTIKELLILGYKYLHKDETKLILATILNQNPLELSIHLDDKVEDELVLKYKKCLENIEKGLPIQYALGYVNFYSLNFIVDERVLIPRFETEELVYNANIYLNKYFKEDVDILDLCTGSGCIGLTLKHLNKKRNITMSDISKDALDVSRINANNLNLDVKLVESDLFTNLNNKFDCIISNPPYVSLDDEVDEIVLNNEPKIALYANNNGLEYYEKILSQCENYLNSKYLVAFEIGNTQKEEVIRLINKYLNNVKIITKQDMSKKDRMVFIFKNIEIDE